ncbi:hypothetical protein E4U41_006459, partial [Claviceps citrina]
MLPTLLLTLSVSLFAFASPENHVSYESHVPMASCARRTAIDGQRLVRLTIALSIPPAVADSAAALLLRLSDPRSKSFAQHLTPSQVNHLFASDPRQVGAVARWLRESRVVTDRWSLDVDHLLLDMTSANAGKLLRTSLVECVCGARTYICLDTYHLPEAVAGHVDHVTAQLRPGRASRHFRSRRRVLAPEDNRAASSTSERPPPRRADCFKYVTPECLRLLYGIPSSPGEAAHPNNSIGVFASDWLTWIGQDLDQFFADFQPSLVSHRPVLMPIDGGFRNESLEASIFHLEPNLDFGYSMSLVEPLPVTDIQVGDKYLRGNLNSMLAGFDKHYCVTALDPAVDPVYPDEQNVGGYNALDCGNRQPPLVISISWAQPEAELPARYARRQCAEFLKLGLQGVTVLAASGDAGPASGEGTCIDRSSGLLNTTTGRFSPSFPASCPWVTAVGGTQAGAERDRQAWTPGADFPPETAFT